MGESAWNVRRLPLVEVEQRTLEIADVYRRAFGFGEYQRNQFLNRLEANLYRYRDTVLLAVEDERGELLGFLYGYDFRRGQWWPEQIGPALEAAGHAEWMEDTFELAELEVDPRAQRQGVGTALLRTLFRTVRHRYVLLSTTADPDDRAKVLYRRHGFVDLLPEFRYPGVRQPAVIMGRRNERTED